MLKRPRKPAIPRTAGKTIRKSLADLLAETALTARDVSGLLRISEKEVYTHLEHLKRVSMPRAAPWR